VIQLSGVSVLAISDYNYGVYMINVTCDNYTCYLNG